MAFEISSFIAAFDGKVKIIFETEEPGESTQTCGYKSTSLLTVLNKIINSHGIGRKSYETVEEAFDKIFNVGDGCDYILTMETGGMEVLVNGGSLKLDDEDYIDC